MVRKQEGRSWNRAADSSAQSQCRTRLERSLFSAIAKVFDMVQSLFIEQIGRCGRGRPWEVMSHLICKAVMTQTHDQCKACFFRREIFVLIGACLLMLQRYPEKWVRLGALRA